MRTYTFHITRSGPDNGGRQNVFEVQLEERMTVLDALFKIQRRKDSSLAFRCSCRVGMCGTCAMSIDRMPRLACQTRVVALKSNQITVAPLPHLPVIKDLVVSMDPFFAQWKKIFPAFHPADPDTAELARVPWDSEYARLSEGKHDCLCCGACFAACGIKGLHTGYLGPAAINQAYLRLIDPRNGLVGDRLKVLNDERAGIWRCHTQFNCVAACPKGISLTDSIVRLKRAMLWPSRFFRAPKAESKR